MNRDKLLILTLLEDLQKLNEKSRKLSKKQLKIAQAAPPPDEITADDFKALRDKSKEVNERPGNPEYYTGTNKSNKSMAREIKKCAKKPRPKSCYDYWDADKKYDKSKKKNELNEIEFVNLLKEFIELDEKRKRRRKKKKRKKLSAKNRKTLKKKAENANMPLGALTSVYRKGLAAWLTGHRQGVPQHQWAMARVNSFIRGGKTRSVDKAEWRKVQKHRGKKWK